MPALAPAARRGLADPTSIDRRTKTRCGLTVHQVRRNGRWPRGERAQREEKGPHQERGDNNRLRLRVTDAMPRQIASAVCGDSPAYNEMP